MFGIVPFKGTYLWFCSGKNLVTGYRGWQMLYVISRLWEAQPVDSDCYDISWQVTSVLIEILLNRRLSSTELSHCEILTSLDPNEQVYLLQLHLLDCKPVMSIDCHLHGWSSWRHFAQCTRLLEEQHWIQAVSLWTDLTCCRRYNCVHQQKVNHVKVTCCNGWGKTIVDLELTTFI
jgi:hypothetical protein